MTPPAHAPQIRLLQEIAGLTGLPLDEQLRRVLAKAAELLEADVAAVHRLDGSRIAVAMADPEGAGLAPDETFSHEAYCDLALSADDVVAIPRVSESAHREHPCFARFRYETYAGSTVPVNGETFGTLCLLARSPRRPFSDDERDLLRFLGPWVGTVIEREQTTEALRRSEARLRSVVENTPVILFAIDEDERFTLLQGAGLEALGLRPGDRLGERWDAHGRDIAPVINGKRTVLRREPSRWLAELDGRWYESQLIAVPAASGEAVDMVGVSFDVTEREAQRAAATEAVRAKERFLANMSHEMRTPLNAVHGLSHLLAQTALTAEQDRLLGGITTSAGALLGIIDDLLDVARLGAGRLPFEADPFAPADVIDDVQAILQTQAAEKRIALQVEVLPAVPEVVVGDPTRLRQVILNLASNAVKFTGVGSVRVALDARPEAEGVRLLVTVADTGIGIPADRLGDIFDPFTQAADGATRRFGGSGLGLAIVKELVELQGGTVSVESVEGEGSTFRVEIPVGTPQDVPDAAPEPAAAPSDLTGLRVLLVEDNQMNRFLARGILEGWGVAVTEAHDGREAVRAVASDEPPAYDVVLMDLQMPGMDGVAATRYIRDVLGVTSDALPILALTASVLASQNADVLSAGLNDFILKPFDPAMLRSRIGAWTGRADAGGAPAAVPGIDVDEIARYTAGRPELAQQVAGLFLSDGRRTVEAIEAAYGARDYAAAGAAAHTLKGQASYVGAVALAATAARMEASAEALDRVALASDVPLAVRQYLVAADELARLYPQPALADAEAAGAEA